MRRRILEAVLVVLALAPSAFGQVQAPHRPNQLQQRGLSGPVHSVDSTKTVQGLDGIPRFSSRKRITFTPEGFLTSDENWDANGNLILRWTFTLDANGHLLAMETFNPAAKAPNAVRTVERMNNRTREVLKYDANGNLLDRAEISFGPNGSHEEHYDPTGAPTKTNDRQVTRSTEADGSVHVTTSENGRVIGEATTKRTADSLTSHSASETPNGPLNVTTERDNTGMRSVFTSPHGSSATARDANGNIQAQISTNDGMETRTAYRYDEGGREIEVALYRDGKLVQKQTSTYSNDERGNWVRKSTETTDAGGKRLATMVEERTITYY